MTRATTQLIRRSRMSLLLGVISVGALALAGCTAGSETTGAGEDSGASSSPMNTEVTIVLPEEPRSLASWNAYSNDGFPILRNVGEALINRDPDTNELVGELAVSWEQVDASNWQFTLREGVTFTDGTPFNAQNAADGLNYVLDEANAFPMRSFLGSQTTATAASEYVLNIATADPDPILDLRLYFVTIPSYPAIEADLAGYETNPVGTGPYKLDEWNRGTSITLVPNEDWWGNAAGDEAKGSQAITKATFVFRSEPTVRSAMVASGEADFARWITPEDCGAAADYLCVGGPTVETAILRLDNPHIAMSDVRVREAVALSFDKQAVMDILGGGELVSAQVAPTTLGYNDSLEPYAYDLEKAKALVAEAKADGVDVTAEIVVAAREGFIPRAGEITTLIADGINAAGLNATTSVLETAPAEEQWTLGYDNIPDDRGWAGFWFHGNELFDYSASGGYYTCGGSVSAYCNAEVDAMYKGALQLSGDDRDLALQEIAAYLYEDVALVPVGQPSFFFGLGDRIDWMPRADGFILLKEIGLK
jgi:peptide/nickel transport system substrate-binding protein